MLKCVKRVSILNGHVRLLDARMNWNVNSKQCEYAVGEIIRINLLRGPVTKKEQEEMPISSDQKTLRQSLELEWKERCGQKALSKIEAFVHMDRPTITKLAKRLNVIECRSITIYNRKSTRR